MTTAKAMKNIYVVSDFKAIKSQKAKMVSVYGMILAK